jgi:hypothetical protein
MPTKTRTARYTLFGLEVVENIGLIIVGIATVVAGYHLVALARYLILDIKELDVWRMLAVSGSVLPIALAVLVIRYGHVRFPYAEDTVSPGSGPQPGLRKE